MIADYAAATRRYEAEFARLQAVGRKRIENWPRSPLGRAWARLVRHVAAAHGKSTVSMGRLMTEARRDPVLWDAVVEVLGRFTRPTAPALADRVDRLIQHPVDGLLVVPTASGLRLVDAETPDSVALLGLREKRRKSKKPRR